MYLELTPEEAKILQIALDLYESKPSSDGLMGSIFGAMLGPKKDKEEINRQIKEDFDKVDNEIRQRKLTTARLRVKFLEAIERPTEFAR